MGEPYHSDKKPLCNANGVVPFQQQFTALLRRLSERVMGYRKAGCHLSKVYSIDEAFAYLSA